MKFKTTALIFISAALALAFLGSTTGVWPFAPKIELSQKRFLAIKTAIKRTPDSVIVLGDSIVEGAPLPNTICGHAVVNAGVTGAAIEYFDRHATEFLGSSRPRLIVLAVGINNASPTAAKKFQSHYQETVTSLSDAAVVLVATITPVRSGAGSAGYDAALVQGLNAVIKATPSATGVIDLNSALSGANWTTDGIHFGPDGYAIWTKTVVDGIHVALGCSD
jgi:lysophospholipase L1-like esterase